MKKLLRTIPTLLLTLIILSGWLAALPPQPAQAASNVIEEWVARYNGPGNNYDSAWDMAIDTSGNVYVTGDSNKDYATVKYDNNGVEQWVARHHGPGVGLNRAYAIALDTVGNVYITGEEDGIGTGRDYATIKYDSNGVEQWVTRYNSPGNGYERAFCLVVDASGNVYVTGESNEFGTDKDYATVKYDNNGIEQWVARYNGPENMDDSAIAIAVDTAGSVYVTGTSVDSNVPTWDYATIKYDSSGVEQWVARYHGIGGYGSIASDMAIDTLGNVYVTGSDSGRYATVKYDNSGAEQWVARYNEPDLQSSSPNALAIDASGNIYITGRSYSTGTNSKDYATVKYDNNGIEQWVARSNDSTGDEALAIAIDTEGNVYVTGNCGSDYATFKYDSSGVEQWVMRYNGPGNYTDIAQDIAVDTSGNVYVTGYSYGSNGYPDYATIKYSQNPPPIANAGIDQTVHVGDIVTLDGNASYDPNGNVPLTYEWSLASLPNGSTAILSDPAIVNPAFTPDVHGDYTIQLIVKDSLGTASLPDTVIITTTNSIPIAEAGPDQSVTIIGTIIQLDGTQSYDVDGDNITYEWSFVSLPTGSSTSLVGASTTTPTFIADVNGTYEAQLIVSDPFSQSLPDTVIVSFENIKPAANAGASQSVVVGQVVTIDGTASSDANGDALTYSWSLISFPEGSLSVITNPTYDITTIIPDLPGTYVVQLIVNDGFINSDPSTIQVQAVTTETMAIEAVQTVQNQIVSLSPEAFKNANMQNTLLNHLNAVIAKIEAGNYAGALGQLQNNILAKTDGCANSGAPDKNDWITDAEAQGIIYPYILDAIAKIEILMQN
jgi:hypothetical protein